MAPSTHSFRPSRRGALSHCYCCLGSLSPYGGTALASCRDAFIGNCLTTAGALQKRKPGQMSRLPFGRNPFADTAPTPSMVAEQARPSPSVLVNASRPPPPNLGEKHDKGRKRDDAGKTLQNKRQKGITVEESPSDSVASTFGSVAAENFSDSEVKLLKNRTDEEAEFNFKAGLGDAFYHGLRVLALKNSTIKDQERSLKKLKSEASSYNSKMGEIQKKLDDEVKARKDDVDRLQLALDKANFDLDSIGKSHESEISKLKGENDMLSAGMRKGQSEAYNAGFLDYLRNFLAADPDYNWSTHFAPSTPSFMLQFKDDNADLIAAAKEELRLKIESEKKAIVEAKANKTGIAGHEKADAASPSQTVGT